MNFAVINFLFIYAAYWGSLFHLLLSKKQISNNNYGVCLILILASLIPDTFNLINVYRNISSDLPALSYYSVFPALVYYVYLKSQVIKKPSKVVMLLLTAQFMLGVYTIWLQFDEPYEDTILGFSSIIITIVFSLYHFYKLFKTLEVPRLQAYPMFWISSGLLMYGAGSLFVHLLKPIIITRDLYFTLWPIHQLILYSYIFFINKAIRVAVKHPEIIKKTTR